MIRIVSKYYLILLSSNEDNILNVPPNIHKRTNWAEKL